MRKETEFPAASDGAFRGRVGELSLILDELTTQLRFLSFLRRTETQ